MLLKNEEKQPGELGIVKHSATEFDAGMLRIVTSSITIIEVLQSSLDDPTKARFQALMRRSNFTFIEPAHAICELAAEIRGYYRESPLVDIASGKNIYPSTPDCIHVASAIAAEKIAAQKIKLWTTDEKNKPQTGEAGLIQMSGKVANKYDLRIVRPSTK